MILTGDLYSGGCCKRLLSSGIYIGVLLCVAIAQQLLAHSPDSIELATRAGYLNRWLGHPAAEPISHHQLSPFHTMMVAMWGREASLTLRLS